LPHPVDVAQACERVDVAQALPVDVRWGIAREHSRKPQAFYDLALRHTPQAVRRADLFSRQTRSRFEGWGNEYRKFDQSPVAVGAS
jgi:N6-adenosine-specific RNA methylase IME4